MTVRAGSVSDGCLSPLSPGGEGSGVRGRLPTPVSLSPSPGSLRSSPSPPGERVSPEPHRTTPVPAMFRLALLAVLAVLVAAVPLGLRADDPPRPPSAAKVVNPD